jgi:predicted nicotinamide N-methyase
MAGGLPDGRSGCHFTETPLSAGSKLESRKRFVRQNTALIAPPHVPEIRLHLADEAHGLWHRTEEELEEIGLQPPYWAFAWAGGQGLARHVLDHPEMVKGKRILDLASGSGLVAIAAGIAGAARVVANDIDPFCRAAIELNAAENGIPVDFEGADLLGELPSGSFDVILAGDVFYDRAMTSRLVPWFDTAVARGISVFVGDPGRSYLPVERLRRLTVHEVAVTRALEDSESKRTTVWQFGG